MRSVNIGMIAAKIAATIMVAAMYLAFVWGLRSAWNALSWWQFLIALCLYLPPATLVFYWAYMPHERRKKSNEGVPELSGYIVTLLKPMAGLHNLAHNWLPMTAVFLWPSFRPATTMRLNDYVDHGRGRWSWHLPLALAIREQLLNWADPDGVHR
jgi:Ca2+/Na+ antiporter